MVPTIIYHPCRTERGRWNLCYKISKNENKRKVCKILVWKLVEEMVEEYGAPTCLTKLIFMYVGTEVWNLKN